jgi:hypothetical protein
MKVILVARKALEAYLMSSAARRPVKSIGVSLMNSGRRFAVGEVLYTLQR